jgi:predicted O-methyltransferase YrrM
MTIRKLIFGQENIYNEFIYDEKNVDLQGWGSKDPIFEYLLPKIKPNLIIELGTWKGVSAIHMINLCLKYKFECEILCIDTFTGSSEHWLKNIFFDKLKIKNGFPSIYNIFLTNIHYLKLEKKITPLPTSTNVAIEILKFLKIKSNFIYIDASHSYNDVKNDTLNYKELLEENGLILFDDFHWRGVNKAVKEMSEFLQLKLYHSKEQRGKAVLTNNKNLDLKSFFKN